MRANRPFVQVHALVTVAIGLLLTATAPPAAAQDAPRETREILVPFDDLNVLLECQPKRVLLTREEYQELLDRSRGAADSPQRRAAAVVAADYQATVTDGRAQIVGRLEIDVPDAGLYAVGLDLAGVGLQAATLADASAPIGLADDGRPVLFVAGPGRKSLTLQLIAPVEATAALQSLNVTLPTPAAARLRLTVPGNVEVKSGAAVVSREVDEEAGVTRFELLPVRGGMSLVMTLNNRQQRAERLVLARGVYVDELTTAYERLHASVSLAVLHQAVDQFRFVVPEGFEVTSVATPLLARWAMVEEDGRQLLDVRLREATTDTVVINLSAVRVPAVFTNWTLPRFVPLDVAGQVAVVGLLVEDRLKAESLAPAGLVPIDASVLVQALPPTLLTPEPGAARVRPVAAWYAPQADFGLTANFTRPEERLLVTSNLLLTLDERRQVVRGGFNLLGEAERVFAFDFSVPAGWEVEQVTAADGTALAFERHATEEGASRIRVRLLQGVPAGQETSVYFQATSTPEGWLDGWTSRQQTFPVFAIAGAARDEGAIAVTMGDDLAVRPEEIAGLVPLDENEKGKYGLADVATNLAYRYEGHPYQVTLAIDRLLPRTTARTYSFLRLSPDALDAHCELVYDVQEAHTRQLAFALPDTTPGDLYVTGLDGVAIKEYTATTADGLRHWTVVLAEARLGRIRLAVDFQQSLPAAEPKDWSLPVIQAERVAYQSGFVAVEGHADFDVELLTHPRKVDVGEMAEADYQPGRRLLGAFGFVGDTGAVTVNMTLRPDYALPPALVERGEYVTLLAAEGTSQTAARFRLRTKAPFLEVKLPEGSSLWSADFDGVPLKPQRQGASLLVSLPAGGDAAPHDLRIVYQTPVNAVALRADVRVLAPQLLLRTGRDAAGEEVPVADLVWHLHLPSGYRVVRSDGTVQTAELPRDDLAIKHVVGALYYLLGGVRPGYGAMYAARNAREFSYGPSDRYKSYPATRAGAPQASAEHAPGTVAGEGYNEYVEGPIDQFRQARDGEWSDDAAVDEAMPMDADLSVVEQVDEAPSAAREPSSGSESQAVQKQNLDGGPADQPVLGEGQAEAPPVNGPGPGELNAPAEGAPGQPGSSSGLTIQKPTYWALEGVRSLPIDLDQSGDRMTFQSLGVDPVVDITLTNRRRLDLFAWAVALTVFMVGVLRTNRNAGEKVRFVVTLGLICTFVPLLLGVPELTRLANLVFYAVSLLAAYYLLVGAIRWLARSFRRPAASPLATTAALLLAAMLTATTGLAQEQLANPADKFVIQVVEPPRPVTVPADAVIVPYDPQAKTGIADARKVLVPYDQFVELWNRAHPEERIDATGPPAPYALAGAEFTATLASGNFLLVEGQLELELYVDGFVAIPLPLAGGVLAKAELDGAPARLTIAQADPAGVAAQQAANAAPAAGPLVVLYASGKGRHRLDIAVRLRLESRGGWRSAEGRLPAAASTALTLRVPEAGTEVRLSGVPDRSSYDTEAADTVIETALSAAGTFGIQWRPKVAQGEIDRALTANSTALLNVQEDGLRLLWRTSLEFRRAQRDSFTFRIPAGYLVEKVTGPNVRGWQARADDEGQLSAGQRIDVTLLKPARDAETVALHLWRSGAVGVDDLAEFDAPAVAVEGASLHAGQVTVMRSPLLELRTVAATGLSRIDVPADTMNFEEAGQESPLGLRPYESYRFASFPFTLRLAAAAVESRVTGELQTVLKISARQRTVESRIVLDVAARPLFQARLVVPDDLELEQVVAPGAYEWTVLPEGDRRVLTIYLATGQTGQVALLVSGRLGASGAVETVALPRFELLDVDRQQGHVVVQVDPAFDVQAAGLEDCEAVLPARVEAWLNPEQRRLAQLTLFHRGAGYGGTLRLSPRRPVVACSTYSNVRVTNRALEETILLDFTVRQAGIREVTFVLPGRMRDARISVPLLRQKTVTPTAEGADAPVRVRLELQDEVMDQLRVLIEHDRLLTPGSHDAPLPAVETGRTERRYLALESAGRSEVLIERQDGLDPVARQQREWRAVADILGESLTQVYLVNPAAAQPRLTFTTKDRAAVETAGARIGLAEAVLVLDDNGAYRATQVYRLDNATEQYLEIELPVGAELWTARVAGEAVKPAEAPSVGGARRVRIPILKTAPGDLDYEVVLKYGGTMSAPGGGQGVSFPLLRTVNINVELSQARLYLPERYRWFGFGGTMRRVEDQATLAAEQLSYRNKQAQRLVETMRGKSSFARLRAASNLKQLASQSETWNVEAQQSGSNEELRRQIISNSAILREADEQVTELEKEVQEITIEDNRGKLNEFYFEQDARRSKNVVDELGDNFDAGAVHGQEASKPDDDGKESGRFNARWFKGNNLENPAGEDPGSDVSRLSVIDDSESMAKKPEGKFQQRVPQVAQHKAEGQMPGRGGDDGDGQGGMGGGGGFGGRNRGRASGENGQAEGGESELVQRYQRRLEEQSNQDGQGQQQEPTELDMAPDAGDREGGGQIDGADPFGDHQGAGNQGVTGYGPVAPAVTAPTGLASLDVELPLRGVEYRFTTPRGEVEITARAAGVSLLDRLGRALAAIVLVALAWVLVRLARRATLPDRFRRIAPALLIVAGIASLLFGILPIAGLLAIIAGIAVLLTRVRSAPASKAIG